MSIFDEMIKQYKDISEVQAFAEAQHKTIVELTKKISKLEEEKLHLEKLLNKTVPILVEPQSNIIKSGNIEDHEENICRMELKKLHDLSLERTLTLEEAKKVELYTKLLLALNNVPKRMEKPVREFSTDDLLEIVSEESDNGSKR